MNALLDTNILIDYLNGIEAARLEIERYERLCISPISWMEVMAGVGADDEAVVRRFLDRFELIEIDAVVAERAVAIRHERKLRLPDAIIWASAVTASLLLVSRNCKDFPVDEPGIRMPYSV